MKIVIHNLIKMIRRVVILGIEGSLKEITDTLFLLQLPHRNSFGDIFGYFESME